MNLTKIIRIAAVFFTAAVGFASTSQAAITSVYFSAGATCTPSTNSALFSPGVGPVQVSLCMTTTATTNTCGFTAVLQSASAIENGKFVLTALDLGPNYNDSTWNSASKPVPLAINFPDPATPAVDLGGTSSAPVAAATNQLLATFGFMPQVGATNPAYVISLAPVSMIAEDPNTACVAQTTSTSLPLEIFTSTLGAPTFTFNRNPAPVFTSPTTTTFSTAVSNTFVISATGNPAPNIAITGAQPPLGVTFTAGTGTATLSSVANVVAGTYPLTFTATAGATTVTQPFTLVVSGKASQTINFTNPGQLTFSSALVPLAATATPSGLPITFSSQTPTICSAFGGNLTMLTLGTCTISASQPGDTTYLSAQVSQSFAIVGGLPGIPTGVAASAGNTQAVISFTPPSSTGGLAISFYTATCNGISGTASSSPITVTGLTNGTPYACTVSATNTLGTGLASAPVNVTPNAVALTLVSVKSRKVHGLGVPTNPFVTYDLSLDTAPLINGAVTTEPRNEFNSAVVGGTGHVIVFKFNNPITAAGSASTIATDRLGTSIAAPGAVTSFTAGSDEVLVTLSGVANVSRVTVSLANVNATGPTAVVSLGFLVADMNNNRAVNSGDLVGAAVRSGVPLDQTNFRFDFNLNGLINSGDIVGAAVRSIPANTLP